MRSSLLALVTAALLLAACSEPSQTTTTAAPPKPAGPQVGSPVTASGKARIALLLPLSGRTAAIGKSLQQAAEMSLFDSGAKDIALSTYDSGETPDSAVQAYNKARADGCALVLGPLFGASASALAPQIQQGGAKVISFSNDEKAAQPGVWIMGIAAPPQVRRVVDYALSSGIKRFAVFAPQTAYGDQMGRVLQDEVVARGGTVVAIEQFAPQSLDMTAAAKRVAASVTGDSKLAILVPIAPPQLSAALASLSAADIDTSKVQLIGTGVWDISGIGSEPQLRGAWYAAPDPDKRADFERRFVATYGRPPHRLATLAYDGVALAAQLARLKPGGDFSTEAITNPAGWSGVDGIFRFLPDGRSERGLAVIEIQGNRNVVVSRSPSSFGQSPTN
ncbi:ABC-type branched-chain amino acid transport system, substrate-binding protein [Enhydrobacter aerosaccus]|uniref:ABC-type branched-chain amino acid transport system, substrate-binding protein n=1 Tax=Enhydrobacter aerosaccus TaxID=225324 RepID=A0A1T4SHV6_9HYPH|nr:penicillin-binding protein activator [Enhydrobacter aerosaccus]SKA27736.1 ABC-type branched-chain amino acid transport system, substrate-binding protein [Enhydrobacter aerosaccus]